MHKNSGKSLNAGEAGCPFQKWDMVIEGDATFDKSELFCLVLLPVLSCKCEETVVIAILQFYYPEIVRQSNNRIRTASGILPEAVCSLWRSVRGKCLLLIIRSGIAAASLHPEHHLRRLQFPAYHSPQVSLCFHVLSVGLHG